MTVIKEHRPGSFAELLQVVERFQGDREFSWYRGTGDSTHSLVPSITRRQVATNPDELVALEKKITNSFVQRSPPFVGVEFGSEWKTMFYMQHYGIPTRLLDWTESPFVALYFALTSVSRSIDDKATCDVAMWMCDPILWNKTSLSHISYKGDILDEQCEEIKAYSPSAPVDQRATTPVMIYGTHNSPRIVAQRGVFALFGKGTEGMEKTYTDNKFPTGALQKIIIGKSHIDTILASLHRKGFAESTIYPDLFGLSLEIRRNFGYR